MIGTVVGNKEVINGAGVVPPARLVEMSQLLSALPSKSRFYWETVSSHHPASCKIHINHIFPALDRAPIFCCACV